MQTTTNQTKKDFVTYFVAMIGFIAFTVAAVYLLQPLLAFHRELLNLTWEFVYLVLFCIIGFFTFRALPMRAVWTILSLLILGVLAALLMLQFAPVYRFFS